MVERFVSSHDLQEHAGMPYSLLFGESLRYSMFYHKALDYLIITQDSWFSPSQVILKT